MHAPYSVKSVWKRKVWGSTHTHRHTHKVISSRPKEKKCLCNFAFFLFFVFVHGVCFPHSCCLCKVMNKIMNHHHHHLPCAQKKRNFVLFFPRIFHFFLPMYISDVRACGSLFLNQAIWHPDTTSYRLRYWVFPFHPFFSFFLFLSRKFTILI